MGRHPVAVLLVLALVLCHSVTALSHPHHSQGVQQPLSDQRDWQGSQSPWARTLLQTHSRAYSGALLRQSVAQVPLLLHGQLQELSLLDNGRLTLASIAVDQVHRGSTDGAETIKVVVFGGNPSAKSPFDPHHPQFFFLQPMPEHSYLRQQLGEGDFYVPVSQQLPVTLHSNEAAQALGQWLQLADHPVSVLSRIRAFALLASGEPALSHWGLAELALVNPPQRLTAAEWAGVSRVMAESLPAKGQLALQLAQWPLKTLRADLSVAESDSPVTRYQVRLARYQLGHPPDLQSLLRESDSEQPRERAAAVRLLALLASPQAFDRVTTVALEDTHGEVREVAIQALAETQDGKVLPVLLKALDTPVASQRFRVGQALSEFTLAQQRALLTQSLTTASEQKSREYAAKLMVHHFGRQDPQVMALRQQLPEGEVRRILAEGAVDRSRVHAHDGHDH